MNSNDIDPDEIDYIRMPPKSRQIFALIEPEKLALLKDIVKELAEGVSYNHTDGFQYCAYCNGFYTHDIDCLVARARRATEMNL